LDPEHNPNPRISKGQRNQIGEHDIQRLSPGGSTILSVAQQLHMSHAV